MKVFVTGANGFLGAAVVKHLREKGYSVRVLLRAHSDTAGLDGYDVEKVTGDVTSPAVIDRALDGCKAVLHIASLYRFSPWWDREGTDLYRTNVGGTRVMLEAARTHNIRRFVFTSSIATVGRRPDGRPSDEETPFNLWNIASHYARSKLLAEYEVLRYCARGLPALIVNPAAIIGEGDRRPTPTGELIVNFLNRKYPGYYNSAFTFADVDNVARAHVAALEKGRIGEKYILSDGRPYTLREIFMLLERVSGIKAPVIRFPYGMIMGAAYFDELVSRFIRRKEPRMRAGILQFGRVPVEFDNSRAVKELGYSVSPLKETMAKAVAWYRENGYAGKGKTVSDHG